MVSAVLLTAFIIYSYFLIRVWRGMGRLQPSSLAGEAEPTDGYSLIIAAHNEALMIAACLQPLIEQENPPAPYEIIVAADRCSDGTAEIVRSYQARFADLHLIEIDEVPPGVSPKKHALATALDAARHDRFLFLDADVIPTRRHLSAMHQAFQSDAAAVISLMKFHPPENRFQDFLIFEKLVSWCIAGAGVGFQQPIISYGGNWGYTRNAYHAVRGFADIRFSLSGDDDLLLQRMGAQGLKSAVCLAEDGWVRTTAPQTFSQFLRQRRRHFSAGRRYRRSLQVAYLLFHGSNLLLWAGGFLFWEGTLLLGLKLVGDSVVLQRGQRLFSERFGVLKTLLYNAVYMIYNTLIGPLGHIGRIRW